MPDILIDYSTGGPTIARIKELGATGVVRYITGRDNLDPAVHKDLFPAERDALFEAGLSISLVFEIEEERAKNATSAKGKADAERANRHADELGHPKDRPIIYAVDYEAELAEVTAYFRGINSFFGRPVGVYGGYVPVHGLFKLGLVKYGMQTIGWSGFRNVENSDGALVATNRDAADPGLCSHAQLFQYEIRQPPGSRENLDLNEVVKSFPVWKQTVQPKPLPEKPARPLPVIPDYDGKTENLKFRGKRTCICVATSLPWVEYRMLEAGLIKSNIDIFQMGYNAGGVSASAGTHDGGGNTDTSQHTDAHLKVWREMGWTMQRRTPAQGFSLHAHGWPKGCPHLSRGGRNQATQWERGQNGLSGRGPITGPSPKGKSTPTWKDALAAYKKSLGI